MPVECPQKQKAQKALRCIDLKITAAVAEALENEAVKSDFRDKFREARHAALKDAEAFDEVLFVLERFGSFLRREIRALGAYASHIAAAARYSPLAEQVPAAWPSFHTGFDDSYELVRTARNDAMHQGAFARHLTNHALELTLVLEDALMDGSHVISQFMVKSPVCACLWHPISFIRQTLLLNSFTYLPVEVNGDKDHPWQLVSDCLLAQYLRRDVDAETRHRRLAKSLSEAIEEKGIVLLKPRTFDAGAPVNDIFKDHDHLPVLVTTKSQKSNAPGARSEELVGILTPFDVL